MYRTPSPSDAYYILFTKKPRDMDAVNDALGEEVQNGELYFPNELRGLRLGNNPNAVVFIPHSGERLSGEALGRCGYDSPGMAGYTKTMPLQ